MRTFIQNKLSELEDVECGKSVSDDIIEENKTYFGYTISKNYDNSDFDKNYTYRVNITGYVTRKTNASENTQSIVDEATENIIDKLKEINFKCNSIDINITDSITKTQITGYAIYNEINNTFIV